jgi:hypothetical protein
MVPDSTPDFGVLQYMNSQEALEKLKGAGLIIRRMDDGSLIGGGYRDASGSVAMIYDSFLIRPESTLENPPRFGRIYTPKLDELYTVQLWVEGQTNPDHNMLLEDAVTFVIEHVKPGVSIEAPPRVIVPGPSLY